MKLGSEALLEIVNIVQYGLMAQVDISDQLREVDFEEKDGSLSLTEQYKERRDRRDASLRVPVSKV